MISMTEKCDSKTCEILKKHYQRHSNNIQQIDQRTAFLLSIIVMIHSKFYHNYDLGFYVVRH